MEWKLLQSEYLHREPWLTVRKDKAETPDGKIVEAYYVHEYPDWVNAVPVTEDGKIIMVKQYRHAIGRTLIEIPGGTMDPDDVSPEFAMRRELLEETGYAFTEVIDLGAVSANPSTNTNLTHMFLAKGGKKVQEQQLDHNEDIEVILMTPAEVVRLLKENKIVQSLHASCLFYALAELGLLKY
ncbi:NUDIX hydrolase [Chitinophaga sedimenti]|uniref:NUDIX hydrolase n=1 Tax=Chitinophaga sedimenti TaxID=2033606 RepID=UPI00200387C7|nr:NUDIX hydrolase [Chitinophaga sedimenti]MCK7554560.1 NUDIX hydrolase [Chitinophaga sedimenti]